MCVIWCHIPYWMPSSCFLLASAPNNEYAWFYTISFIIHSMKDDYVRLTSYVCVWVCSEHNCIGVWKTRKFQRGKRSLNISTKNQLNKIRIFQFSIVNSLASFFGLNNLYGASLTIPYFTVCMQTSTKY